MGSELNMSKKRFDLTMSRRTRKPLNNFFKESHQESSITSSPPKEPPEPNEHQHDQEQQQQQDQREQDQEQQGHQDQQQEQDQTEEEPYRLNQHRHDQEQQQDRDRDQDHQEQRQQQQQEDREQRQEQKEEEEQGQEMDHKSLNQLMRGGGGVEGKSSLGEHFSEEEKHMKMQIVKKNNDKQSGENGVKFRGFMGRYVRVLSGLIKAKHDTTRRLSTTSKKKHNFRLKL